MCPYGMINVLELVQLKGIIKLVWAGRIDPFFKFKPVNSSIILRLSVIKKITLSYQIVFICLNISEKCTYSALVGILSLFVVLHHQTLH